MANDVREYLREAQAAEIRGDKARAVNLLKKAADVYRKAGNTPRAMQMLRHAQRLEGSPAEPRSASNAPEWILKNGSRELEPQLASRNVQTGPLPRERPSRAGDPEFANRGPAGADSIPTRSEQTGPASRERQSRAGDPEFANRGPALADPTVEAWCSFCCRPSTEVGPLIAGPAGAFVCGLCAGESMRLLGSSDLETRSVSPSTANVDEPGARSESMRPLGSRALEMRTVSPSAANVDEPGAQSEPQRHAIELLESALREQLQFALLVGPEGSGKTFCLRSLEARGLGTYAADLDRVPTVRPGPVLLDSVERISPSLLEKLATTPRAPASPVVLACCGNPPSSSAQLRREGMRFALYDTRELFRATAGKLPIALLERIQRVVVLPPPELADLTNLARRLGTSRGAEISAELASYIAAKALKSGRGGHEVRALVDRLPSGDWSLTLAPPKSRAATKRKRRRS